MQNESADTALINKYNKPVPRYTSYPTVPFWTDSPDTEKWVRQFTDRFRQVNGSNGMSLYIHLPFCESLCTYCGCNKKITTNHSVEEPYLDALEKEWLHYITRINDIPVIKELHLGGGTPTFFAPGNLERLLNFITTRSVVHPQCDFSIEGHPNNTTADHLQVLYDAGFRRISYGIQDMDPAVQRIINRIQPLENVVRATEAARAIGFQSINYDLIYGLPLQSLNSIRDTIRKIVPLKPDRIAFYSYAHVPWVSKAQRLFDESHLPSPEEKLNLYLEGKKMLINAGYADIGMDHFSLPTDELYIAWKKGKLHRNFMGYTTQQTGMLLGLGVSAISDTGNAYAQNEKSLHDYYAAVNAGKPTIAKGYFLDETDIAFKQYILNISCNGGTSLQKEHEELLEEFVFPRLAELKEDGIIEFDKKNVKVTPKGRSFIRNICSAFDLYLQKKQTKEFLFSKSI